MQDVETFQVTSSNGESLKDIPIAVGDMERLSAAFDGCRVRVVEDEFGAQLLIVHHKTRIRHANMHISEREWEMLRRNLDEFKERIAAPINHLLG